MQQNTKNSHELDLDVVKKHGYIENSEAVLNDRNFMTKPKVDKVRQIAAGLLKYNKNRYKVTK